MDTPMDFPALEGAEFMALTTHRRTGEPVHTTVWFAQVGDRLYVTTMSGAGKAKRITNNEQVVVAPRNGMVNSQGPGQRARARLLDPTEFPAAINALRSKYHPQFDEVAARSDTRS